MGDFERRVRPSAAWGSGGGMYTRKARATREAPCVIRDDQPDTREGQASRPLSPRSKDRIIARGQRLIEQAIAEMEKTLPAVPERPESEQNEAELLAGISSWRCIFPAASARSFRRLERYRVHEAEARHRARDAGRGDSGQARRIAATARGYGGPKVKSPSDITSRGYHEPQ